MAKAPAGKSRHCGLSGTAGSFRTQALLHKSGVRHCEAAGSAFSLPNVRLTWPLTGRSKEMRLIEAGLSDRDCSGIVVCGGAGVGKSRVAREATAQAASRGCEVRWAVATTSAQTLPLGALAAWAGSAGGDGVQLVGGVIESLTCAPDGATVVVGVDDAPLLDDLSIFVVHQIVQRRAAKVVLTVRDGETVPAVQEVLRGASLTGLSCSRCHTRTPRRWCLRRWVGLWMRMRRPGCGS